MNSELKSVKAWRNSSGYLLSFEGDLPPNLEGWEPVNIVPHALRQSAEPAKPAGLKFVSFYRYLQWYYGVDPSNQVWRLTSGHWRRECLLEEFNTGAMDQYAIPVPAEYAVRAEPQGELEIGDYLEPVEPPPAKPKVLREWLRQENGERWRFTDGMMFTRHVKGASWRRVEDSPYALTNLVGGVCEVRPGTDTPITEPLPSLAKQIEAKVDAIAPKAMQSMPLPSNAVAPEPVKGAEDDCMVMPYDYNRLLEHHSKAERRIAELTEQFAETVGMLSDLTKDNIKKIDQLDKLKAGRDSLEEDKAELTEQLQAATARAEVAETSEKECANTCNDLRERKEAAEVKLNQRYIVYRTELEKSGHFVAHGKEQLASLAREHCGMVDALRRFRSASRKAEWQEFADHWRTRLNGGAWDRCYHDFDYDFLLSFAPDIVPVDYSTGEPIPQDSHNGGQDAK